MFITFEGGEGSGKTTCIQHVVKALEERGKSVLLSREPGGTPISEEIRNVILDKRNTDMTQGQKPGFMLLLVASISFKSFSPH